MSRALAVLALAASAAAQSLHHVADEFTLVGASDLSAVLRFSAALPMQNEAQLEATLLDISNPQSPNCASRRSRSRAAAAAAHALPCTAHACRSSHSHTPRLPRFPRRPFPQTATG